MSLLQTMLGSIHMVILGSSECMCTPTDLIVDFPTIAYQNAGPNINICHEGTGTLGCGDEVAGYTYSWKEPNSATGALSSLTDPNPTINTGILQNIAPLNDPNPSNKNYNFTLTTQRGSGCSTSDKVRVRVYPFLNGEETLYECQGDGTSNQYDT